LQWIASLECALVYAVQALELFGRIGDVAEAEGHHPDLHLVVSCWRVEQRYRCCSPTQNDLNALDVRAVLNVASIALK
jgi:pterin-4a-carbinolamine dehydratase